MKIHQKEKINVNDIAMGMFISELDRPWLETPFMLQGFLIEDEIQIKHLRSLCRHVVIDRTLSMGEHFKAPEVEASEPKVIVQNIKLKSHISASDKKSGEKKKPTNHSFFNVLLALKSGIAPTFDPNQTPITPEAAQQNTDDDLRVSYVELNEPNTKISPNQAFKSSDISTITLTQHIKQDISSLVGISLSKAKKLLNLGAPFSKQNKTTAEEKSKTHAYRQHANAQKNNQNEKVVIRIYEEETSVEEEIATIYPVFEKSQIATRQIFEDIAHQKNIDLTHINQSLDSMLESIERNPDALMWLAKLKKTDDYAYNHALNVSINLMAFGNFMALPKSLIRDLGMAGLLQDVGKIEIASAILQKSTPLSQEEFAAIKTHVQFSINTLHKTANISERVMHIVEQHHERYDGSGYPRGLKGEEISLVGQMAGVMDTYCAMTTTKPYSKGLFSQEVLEKIYATKDKSFSAVLINQLIQFFGIYPVSSLVELNTGEVAVVIQQNHVRRLQPRVMILLNADKTRNQYPVTLDLILSPPSFTGEPYSIIKGLPSDSYGLSPSDYYV